MMKQTEVVNDLLNGRISYTHDTSCLEHQYGISLYRNVYAKYL